MIVCFHVLVIDVLYPLFKQNGHDIELLADLTIGLKKNTLQNFSMIPSRKLDLRALSPHRVLLGWIQRYHWAHQLLTWVELTVQPLPITLFKCELKLSLQLTYLIWILEFTIYHFQNFDLLEIMVLASCFTIKRKLNLVLGGHSIDRWAIVEYSYPWSICWFCAFNIQGLIQERDQSQYVVRSTFTHGIHSVLFDSINLELTKIGCLILRLPRCQLRILGWIYRVVNWRFRRYILLIRI